MAKKQKSLPRELASKKRLDPVDRRILFTRLETGKKSVVLPDLLLAINLASKKIGLPEHIRLIKLWFTPSGAISGLLKEGATGEMLLNAQKEIIDAAKKIDLSIINLTAAEQWYKLRVHTVSLNRYLHSAGINLLKEEIESTTGLDMPNNPQWINEKKAEERFNNEEIAFSSIIITVRIKA